MHILLTGPNKENPGDDVIRRGCEYLIREAFPIAFISHGTIHNHLLTQHEFLNEDLIIHAGTPFLWDRMHLTHKYANMMNLFKLYPNVPKLFMGIGAAVPLERRYDEAFQRAIGEGSRELFDQATIIGRDPLSKTILEYGSGIDYLLPCPSFWCPLPGINIHDTKTIDMRGKQFNDVDELLNTVSFRGKLITDRVHHAIPAWVSGAEVELVAKDSRAETFHWGKEWDFKFAKQLYIDILRRMV